MSGTASFPGPYKPLIVFKRDAFANRLIALPNGEFESLENCVYHGPKGFSTRPVLNLIYGSELARLFQEVLKVSNATSGDVLDHLKGLQENSSTSIADVVTVYTYLQTFQLDR